MSSRIRRVEIVSADINQAGEEICWQCHPNWTISIWNQRYYWRELTNSQAESVKGRRRNEVIVNRQELVGFLKTQSDLFCSHTNQFSPIAQRIASDLKVVLPQYKNQYAGKEGA